MSFEIAKAVWDYKGEDLNGIQTAVLARMAWYASDSGRDIFPTIATLCAQIKFGETAVKEAIRYLKENDFLIIEEQSLGRKSNRYQINLKRLSVINQFDSNSSMIEETEPVARRPVANEPVARRRVNPSPGDPNPSPDDYINTSKDDLKNNNQDVVVKNEILKMFKQANFSHFNSEYFLKNFDLGELHKQLKLLLQARGVSNGVAWLISALKNDYKGNTTLSQYSPPSHEIWSDGLQEKRNKEAESVSNPNDWREKMLQEYLAKIQTNLQSHNNQPVEGLVMQ